MGAQQFGQSSVWAAVRRARAAYSLGTKLEPSGLLCEPPGTPAGSSTLGELKPVPSLEPPPLPLRPPASLCPRPW